MKIDFDPPIDRRNSLSDKWDNMEKLFGISPDEGLPMWTADMDFKAAQPINDAMAARVAHGVHGYHGNFKPYHDALIGWMRRRHDWDVKPDWIINTAGLVNAFAHCVQAYSEPGDGIILFTPFYLSFAPVIRANGREVVESPMINTNGRYSIDLDGLANQLTGREKILVWCSPHNPGGRVWTRAELVQVADFCIAHNLILVSDEIHHDLIFPGHQHVTMRNAAPNVADRLITLVAASKTFNLAGMEFGSAIVENPELHAKFMAAFNAMSTHTSLYGPIMAEAAYRHGDEWLEQVLAYLDGNRKVLEAGLAEIAGVRPMKIDATYLQWVDFSGTGMDDKEIRRRIQSEAKIAASPGPAFGTGGEGFMRFNFAMTRANIIEAVARMKRAFGDLQ